MSSLPEYSSLLFLKFSVPKGTSAIFVSLFFTRGGRLPFCMVVLFFLGALYLQNANDIEKRPLHPYLDKYVTIVAEVIEEPVYNEKSQSHTFASQEIYVVADITANEGDAVDDVLDASDVLLYVQQIFKWFELLLLHLALHQCAHYVVASQNNRRQEVACQT